MKFCPAVNKDIFNIYCSFKHQGNKAQQEKAFRMLQGRKIVSVNTLQDRFGIYVRGMIKKSYGTTVRPAVIYFQGNVPRKATCSCPVILSGVCCHILALLLSLKHYSDTKEKILELTCTQHLQKLHRRSKKGSISIVSLNEIKPNSASMRKKENKIKINPADPNNSSFFKGNLRNIVANLKKLFKRNPLKPMYTQS